MAQTEIKFDQIEVGACYADRHFTVSSELIAAYCGAIETSNNSYLPLESGKRSSQIAPPTLPLIWTPPRVSFAEGTVPSGGIHTAQRWENHRQVHGGEVLRERIVAREKYTRDNKNYIMFEANFENAAGDLVARGVMTLIWPK